MVEEALSVLPCEVCNMISICLCYTVPTEPRPAGRLFIPSRGNMDQEPQTVKIYTDGACSGNPGPGGWAAVLMFGEHRKELHGYVPSTTNNRMELKAAIEALSALNRPCQVDLFSDSAYLVSAFQQGWLSGWQKNHWKNAANQDVANKDLWQQLVVLTGKHDVSWHKVKGHADNPYNNRCDELAVQAIKEGRQADSQEKFSLGEETVLQDETLYRGRILDLHRYRVKLPNDHESIREVVHHTGGAVICAVTDEKEVLLVSQYRFPTGKILLELPAGKMEGQEKALTCAQRELREETGYTAKSWQHLASVYASPGYTDEILHLFLARELTSGHQDLDDNEFLQVAKVSWAQVLEDIQTGQLEDAKSMLAVLLARPYIE